MLKSRREAYENYWVVFEKVTYITVSSAGWSAGAFKRVGRSCQAKLDDTAEHA